MKGTFTTFNTNILPRFLAFVVSHRSSVGIVCLLVAQAIPLSAQFVDSTQFAFPQWAGYGLYDSHIAWGDIDNDGDVDAFLMGDSVPSGTVSSVYLNTGGVFALSAPINSVLTPLRKGQFALGDVDGDGWVDVFMCGYDAANVPRSFLYRNTGGALALAAGASALIENVGDGAAQWGDYDGDGDLDLALIGTGGSGNIARIYTNDENGLLVENVAARSVLIPVSRGDLAWADFNNDGHLDLIISGFDGTEGSTDIYLNDGTGAFSLSGATLPNLRDAGLDVGDLDNDGDVDIILTGEQDDTFAKSAVYRNNGDNTFTELPLGLAVKGGNPAWGDYNEDGWLDILLNGFSGTEALTAIFTNTGAATFIPLVSDLDSVQQGYGAWGDYNGDGTLDILLTGMTDTDTLFRLFENTTAPVLNTPAPPQNLQVAQSGNTATFTWTGPVGYALNDLSYTAYIGSASGSQDIRPAMAITSTGDRTVVRQGDLHTGSFNIKGLAPGTYYWSIAGINRQFESLGFATEASFTIIPPDLGDSTASLLAFVPDSMSQAFSAWGDYDNDGDLDVLIMGEGTAGRVTRIYRNEAGTGFSDAGITLLQLAEGEGRWVDFDQDQDLDLLITGNTAGGPATQLYRNDAGTFVPVASGFTALGNSTADWGDFDQDGDWDLALAGNTGTTRVTQIFENNGGGTFSLLPTSIEGIDEGVVRWGDYDNDGDLDLLVSGATAGGATGRIFANQGQGTFTAAVVLAGLSASDGAWEDYDNDGDMDVLLAGDEGGVPRSIVYRNNGNGSFANAGFSLTGVRNGAVAWGDFNNDHLPDILLTGHSGPAPSDVATRLYVQGPSGTFTESTVNAPALPGRGNGSHVSWADFNRDGKLDILLLGEDPTGKKQLAFLQNNQATSNTTLGVPINLSATQVGKEVLLAWNTPAGTPPALGQGIHYNIYVGTVGGQTDVKSPEASLGNGQRKVVAQGNVKKNSFRLKALPSGTYFWSVQAVDKDFEGSPFAAEQSFSYVEPDFIDSTARNFSVIPQGINNAAMAWGDYDGDGDPDLLMSGQGSGGKVLGLYNNTNGDFTFVPTSLPAISDGALSWADMDEDGDLDILMTGQGASGPLTRIYRNDGSNVFTDLSAGFSALQRSNLAWGDMDNDGDLDLLLLGQNAAFQAQTQLYRNEGGGVFTLLEDLFPDLVDGAARWADLNADGMLDLILTGTGPGGPITRIYRNQSFGIFIPVSAGLINLEQSALDVADFNDDGLPDLLLAGQSGINIVTRVYQNNGNFSFTEFGGAASLEGVRQGSVAWGDYDNDGFPDILLTGTTATTGRVSRVYHNENGSSFVADIQASVLLQAVNQGSKAFWLDYDNDGRLDIALAGLSKDAPLERVFRLYHNATAVAASVPAAPSNLQALQSGEEVLLSWAAPPAARSANARNITYELYVGTNPKGVQIKSPNSRTSDGYRKVGTLGSLTGTSWTLRGLPTNNFYWAVQAIGPNHKASAFSAEGTFNFTAANFASATAAKLLTAPPAFANAALAWADYDNDGDLDFVITGSDQAGDPHSELYRNDGAYFRLDTAATNDLVPVQNGALAWADYDNDGDLDLLITGEASTGKLTRLYQNDGAGGFAAVAASFPGVTDSDVAWGDFNQDGQVDFLLVGEGESAKVGRLFRNRFKSNPADPFTDSSISVRGISSGSVAWGDQDVDGDLDFILTGQGTSAPAAELYRNNGNNTFTVIQGSTLGISEVRESSVEWADYNNDGRPDLLLSGETGTNVPLTIVYTNNPNNTFSPIVITNVGKGKATWGDYDDDGFEDIALTGNTISGQKTSRLYKNNNGLFFQEVAGISGVWKDVDGGADLAWGDMDGNDKLDLILTGVGPGGTQVFELYRNLDGTANLTPGAPEDLVANQVGSEVQLSWKAPGSFPANRVKGLTYNIYVGSTPGSQDIFSAESNIADGFRRMVRAGNVWQSLTVPLNDLPGGTYYWSVQAVDVDFEGGPFAAEQSFTFEPPTFENVTENVFSGVAIPVNIDRAHLSWADFDNDGDLDLLAMGDAGTLPATTLYQNNGGVLVESGINLPLLKNGVAAWGDYNRDGWIDVLFAGEGVSGRQTLLLRNTNGTGFSNAGFTFTALQLSAAAWADIDQDGDLDLALSGSSAAGPVTEIYLNNINITNQIPGFSLSPVALPGVRDGALAWSDFNQDGFPDLLITGEGASGAFTGLFQNNAGQGFTEVTGASLTDLQNSRAAWADFDNDGDTDLLLAGDDGNNPVTKVYANDFPAASFTEVGTPLVGVKQGEVAWGDYDDDGYVDVVITGAGVGNERITRIYKNTGAGNFIEDVVSSAILTNLNNGSALAWGDVDGNNTLDIAIAGNSGSGRALQLIRNLLSPANNKVPGLPRNLQVEQEGDQVKFSWDPPVGTDPWINGYTYEVFVGRGPAQADIRPAMANLGNGYRRLVRLGGNSQHTEWTLNGLPTGSYYWSVQAVDQDFEGSGFPAPQVFNYFEPSFVDRTVQDFAAVPAGMEESAIALGDFDNDDDLDLLVSGITDQGPQTLLYRNGGGAFTLTPVGLINVSRGSLAWGDYNRDGLLDILLTGLGSSERVTAVLRNNGNSTFTNVAQLTGVSLGEANWGDYDNDGDLDIILVGESAAGLIGKIYRNDGGNVFSELPFSLQGVRNGLARWVDFDNDGDLDAWIAGGNDANALFARMYENLGEDDFQAVSTNIDGFKDATADWADFDNDGWVDLLIAGDNGSGIVTKVYRNQKNNTFSEFSSLTGIWEGHAQWGDYNEDGFRDIILIGSAPGDPETRIARIYTNDAGNGFDINPEASVSLPPLRLSAASWGDYTEDQRLDLVLAGQDLQGNRRLVLLRNETGVPVQTISPPVNLAARQVGSVFRFSWAAPNLPDNVRNGLTYNLRVGTTPQGLQTLAPLANPANGSIKAIQGGNTGQVTTWDLAGLEAGTYYWAVQTVGADFDGSGFISGGQFSYQPPDFEDDTKDLLGLQEEGWQDADMDWGDYDNDGDLDLILLGKQGGADKTVLYRNDGGTFTDAGVNLDNLSSGAIGWVDIDDDGWLDVTLTGVNFSGSVTRIYRNLQGTGFAQWDAPLTNVRSSEFAWGDMDNDGDRDLVLIGETDAGVPLSQLYLNNGQGGLSQYSSELTRVRDGVVLWQDVDGDRDLDLVLMGESSTGFVTKLFENRGSRILREVSSPVNGNLPFPGINEGAAAFADINNDGFADLLLSGQSSLGAITKVYRNNGDLTFNLIQDLTGLLDGALDLGDYNDDGYPDLILTGINGGNPLTELYQNNGSGTFVKDNTNSTVFAPVSKGAVEWADVDQDGKLDLALVGDGPEGQDAFRIYRNIDRGVNTVPDAPQNLSANQNGQAMVLSWDTPANLGIAQVRGISYNLYVGLNPGGIDIQSPMANTATGKRRVAAMGPLYQNSWRLEGLPGGTYYWSVQAVDQDFEGSAFGAEGSFTFFPPDFVDVTSASFPNDDGIPVSQADMAWADFDFDSDLDLVVMGATSAGPSTRLYRNNGNGVLANSGIALQNMQNGSLAWGDYDNNELLDLAITGEFNGERALIIYRNAISSFTEVQRLPGLTGGEIAWGDYDNDGDLDLLASGRSSSGRNTLIYRNDGAAFSPVTIQVDAVDQSSVAWGDYNNDGWLDILLSGESGLGAITRVYKNNGNGNFSSINASLANVNFSSVAWGDYDNDGRLDIIVSGDVLGTFVTRIYHNDGNDQFSDAFSFPGVRNGDLAWADFNDDGFIDVVQTGKSGFDADDRQTQLYINDAGGGFNLDTLSSSVLSDLNDGSALAWGDYDLDGKIDLAMAGSAGDGPGRQLRIFKNINRQPNLSPGPPANLIATQMGEEVVLTWDAPANAGPLKVNGLSYNLYIGTSSGGVDVVSPMANRNSGFRRVVRIGPHQARRWVIKDLRGGTYYWGVQAIDQDLEGSEFSEEASFEFSPPDFLDITTGTNLDALFLDMEAAAAAWGDYDNDQDLDLAYTGLTDNGLVGVIYRNNGNGGFERLALLPDSVSHGDLAWGDYNNDGFLDLAISGRGSTGPVTRVFRGNGNGNFVDSRAILTGVSESSLSWGDFDNDGDLDLLVAGNPQGAPGDPPMTKIYMNTGSDRFVDIDTGIPGVASGQVEWMDFNNDGYLDISLTGQGVDTAMTLILINQKNRRFSTLDLGLPPLSESSLAWADMDNDGFEDLLLSGLGETGELSFVFRNNGGNALEQVASLQGLRNGRVAWGDLDEDQRSDIAMTGTNSGGQPRTLIYRNQGGGSFVLDEINSAILRAVDGGSRCLWADYDLDGKLDLLVFGRTAANPEAYRVTLYQNLLPSGTDNIPGVPRITGEDRFPTRVVLKWQPPANATQAAGLTYNVYIGTSPQDESIKGSNSLLSTGYRQIVYKGNAGHNTELEIRNLPTGTYYWSVQAVDQEYEASAFASPDSFFFNSSVFVDVSTSALPNSALGGLADAKFDWGDYDNDGDLDIIVLGVNDTVPIARIYRNNGASGFTESGIVLPALTQANAAWGDYNNDGFLDLILTGASSGVPVTRLFKNDQAGGFTDVTGEPNIQLQGLMNSSIDWGDYNNDGFLDLLLTGFSNLSGPTTRIYPNNRNGGFGGVLALVGVTEGDARFGDYNGDGFLDILLSGTTGSERVTNLYKNTSGESRLTNPFLKVGPISDTLINVKNSSLAWADYDNDGDLDILVSGESSRGPVTRLYQNLGGDKYTELKTVFQGISHGAAAFGDYNEDGFPDIVLAGQSGPDSTFRSTLVYQFDTAKNVFFVDTVASELLTDVNGEARVGFGDYNRDGKLDLLLSGKTANNPDTYTFQLFRNQDLSPESIPTPPANLLASDFGIDPDGNFQLTLRWDPTDTTLRAQGYSYNLIFGSENSPTFRKAPMADTLTGFRQVYRLGNVNQAQSWTIRGLPEGRFFWSVQAVDQDYEASAFAPFDEVIIEIQSFLDVSKNVFSNPPLGSGAGTLVWGDADNDGDLDILSSGEVGEGALRTSLYRYDKATEKYVLDDLVSPTFIDVKNSDAAWGDYNRDGYLDLIICGEDTAGNYYSRIYRNLQNGSFVMDTVASNSVIDVTGASVEWGDFDNDGDPDILITGRSKTVGAITRIYRNEGNSRFSNFPNAVDPLKGVDFGDVSWGDYDKDGFLDFVVTGRDNADNPFTEVYHNEGNGQFLSISSVSPAPITSVKESVTAWGDYNNDGFLDLFLAGEETKDDFRPVSRFYFYDTLVNRFTEKVIPGLVNIKNGQISWGDYNEDGFQDILISGQTSDTSRTSRIYQNSKGQGFSQDARSSGILQDIGDGQSSWGDYDGDGKLDVILSGISKEEPLERSFTLYRNIDTARNKPVLPPLDLEAVVIGTSVNLNWDPPGINPTLRRGLTYNLYVSSASDTLFKVPGDADTLTGYRRIVQMGNIGHSTSWQLKGLTSGTYCWGVQTVGPDFEGSTFAKAGQCFVYDPPVPQIVDSFFAETFVWNDTSTSYIDVADLNFVDQVRIHFKRISTPNWTIRNQVPPKGKRYEFKLNKTLIDPQGVDNKEIGIEYFFEVKGKFGFDARTDTQYCYIVFADPGILIPDLDDGDTQADYNIMSIPLVLEDSTLDAIFDELGPYDIFKWRLFRFNGEQNIEHIANKKPGGITHIDPGNGYWFIIRNNEAIFTGPGTTVRANDAKPYVLHLEQGFNQIGNPYNFNLSWTDVLNNNTPEVQGLLGNVYTYDRGFSQSGVINRFRGAFVFADTTVSVSIPVRKNLSIQRIGPPAPPEVLENPIHFSDWRVNFMLESGERHYWLGAIGMNKLAADGKDPFDWMMPPRIGENVDMSFYHPEFFYPYFTRDIVRTDTAYSWSFTVQSSVGASIIDLTWDNYYFGSSNRQLILIEESTQKWVDMRKHTHFRSVSEDDQRHFTVLYGPPGHVAGELAAHQILLGEPYPNPATSKVFWPISLPGTGPDGSASAELSLYNALGQLVYRRSANLGGKGFHTLENDLRNGQGDPLPPGTYVYKFALVAGEHRQLKTGRLVVR